MPGRPPRGADILLAGGVEGWGEMDGLGLLPYLTGSRGGSEVVVGVLIESWEGLAPLPGLGSLKLVNTACGEVCMTSLLAVVPGIAPANCETNSAVSCFCFCLEQK